MSFDGILVDFELLLVGLIMAGTLYCDGPQCEDPTDDFGLWKKSWDKAKPAWDLAARERGWCTVGMTWENHHGDW